MTSILVIHWIDDFVISIAFVTVKIFGLSTVTGVYTMLRICYPIFGNGRLTMEKERVIRLSTADEPLHCVDLSRHLTGFLWKWGNAAHYVIFGGFLAGIRSIICQHDNVAFFVTKLSYTTNPSDQLNSHVNSTYCTRSHAHYEHH